MKVKPEYQKALMANVNKKKLLMTRAFCIFCMKNVNGSCDYVCPLWEDIFEEVGKDEVNDTTNI